MICHSLGLNIRQRRNMSRRNLFSLLCHTRNLSLIFGLSARFFFGYLVFRAISWLTNKGKPNMIGLLCDFPLVQTGTSSHLEIIRIYHLEPSFKMSAFGLNEHHDHLLLNYLRFAKFQRGQCIKSVNSSFEDAKDTRFLDPTYTVDEVKDILSDIAEVVLGEIELELINSSHTNVLLLQQVFRQSEKWHLNLEADLAELENRELLDKVKNWEENELSSQPVEKPSLSPKKRLAPLNQGGPVQLLNKQIEELDEENKMLRERLRTMEERAKLVISEKESLASELDNAQKEAQSRPKESMADSEDQSKEIDELTETLKLMRNQLTTEIEMKDKSASELENNLISTKHALLDVQHQLTMAEKELEKKFSQTGAYKNLKKMMNSKNDQIRDLRNKLAKYEKDEDEEE